jgi:segregation and condensation protein A
VDEKTIPWWRKALNFAMDGIRSGFGFFSRPAKIEASPEVIVTANFNENPEEETALTEAFPQPEIVAAPAIEAEQIVEPEPAPEPAASAEGAFAERAVLAEREAPAPEPETASLPEAAEESVVETAANSEPETKEIPETEAVNEPEPIEAAEAVVETEPESEPEPESEEIPEIEFMSELVPEPVEVPESAVEAEPEAVPASEPIEAPEPVIEAEPEPEEAAEDEVENEPVPEPVEAFEAVVESEPESEPELVEIQESETVIEPVLEAIERSEPVVEAEPEQPLESVPAPAIEPVADALAAELPEPLPDAEAQPAPAPVLEPEAASEPAASAECAPAERAVPEGVFAERAAPEGAVPEGESAEGAVPPALVLTTPPTAEEKAEGKADEKAAAKLAARQKKLDEGSEQSPFSVIVGQVYDGPLDLLLDLIRKQDIDIYDIPIATITAQFLAYVNQLKAGDVDVAGEFIYTASLLIHIKSKMLLPRADAGPEDAAEDPRRELVERLLEHERFKNAAQMLQQKQMLEAATWSNPGAREFKDDAAAEPEIAADTVDLVRIFRDILERARKRPVFNVDEDSVTVGQMIQFLARRLTMEDKPVALRRLLSHTRSERALIAMFLALLELVRLQAILLRQDLAFSEIFVKKHTGFDAVMSEGMLNARDDWR